MGVGRQTAQRGIPMQLLLGESSDWVMYFLRVGFRFDLVCVYAPGCLMWFFFFSVSYRVCYLRGFFLYLVMRCGIIGWASFFF